MSKVVMRKTKKSAKKNTTTMETSKKTTVTAMEMKMEKGKGTKANVWNNTVTMNNTAVTVRVLKITTTF